jgi:RNA polymerase-binding transcription factor DksA
MERTEAREMLAVARANAERTSLRLRHEEEMEAADAAEAAWADRGQVIEERDEIHGAVDDIDGDLKEIIAAEARLADGSYGICEMCAQPIPDERLRAIPWARRCVTDQTVSGARLNGRR